MTKRTSKGVNTHRPLLRTEMTLLPQDNLLINGIALILTFIVLTKSANSMVDGAVGIAYKFDIPKIFIGVVLVGFGTTTPEFIVSLISALRGNPEIALGNAL